MEPIDERMMKDFTKEVIVGCHHLNTPINLSITKGWPVRYNVSLNEMQKKIPIKYS